jgi:serine/threonine-protein kinase
MAKEAKLPQRKVVYEFDGFRVDPTNRLLLRDGRAVPLTAKTFDLLLLFVESNGRLLEKEEVMRRVWPQSFVEEGNLTRQVSTLRKALGEAPKSDQYIVTVPGYGYKFVAPIKELRETPSITMIAEQTVSTTVIEEEISLPIASDTPRTLSGVQEDAKATPETETRRTKLLIVAAACLVVLVLMALLILHKEQPATGQTQSTVKSIAVLPLKPLNAETRDPVYELGIADSLILKLSGVKEIIVRPLSATRKYTSLEQDPLAAGREQQVDYVLAPSYQLADGKIRVTAQLFNVGDGSVTSVFKCDESCTDIFATQDAISEKVGRLLLTRLTNEQNSRLAKRYTSNEEAYRVYLQGKYFLDRWDQADFRKAIDAFEQAIRLDPNYALAYAELAWAHRAVSYWGLDTSGEENHKAKDAVMRALALDDSLAESYSAFGEIKDICDWDFSAGEQAYQRALALNPNSSEAHAKYGIHFMIVGRLDEAMAEIKSAIDM